MSFMGADQRHAGGFFSPWGESDWETGGLRGDIIRIM